MVRVEYNLRVGVACQRDDAPTKPGTGEPGTGGTALDERFHKQVELRRRHLVVVAEAGVTL